GGDSYRQLVMLEPRRGVFPPRSVKERVMTQTSAWLDSRPAPTMTKAATADGRRRPHRRSVRHQIVGGSGASVTVFSRDNDHLVRFVGELDLSSVPEVVATLERLHGRIVVDLGDVTFVDSAGGRAAVG